MPNFSLLGPKTGEFLWTNQPTDRAEQSIEIMVVAAKPPHDNSENWT